MLAEEREHDEPPRGRPVSSVVRASAPSLAARRADRGLLGNRTAEVAGEPSADGRDEIGPHPCRSRVRDLGAQGTSSADPPPSFADGRRGERGRSAAWDGGFRGPGTSTSCRAHRGSPARVSRACGNSLSDATERRRFVTRASGEVGGTGSVRPVGYQPVRRAPPVPERAPTTGEEPRPRLPTRVRYRSPTRAGGPDGSPARGAPCRHRSRRSPRSAGGSIHEGASGGRSPGSRSAGRSKASVRASPRGKTFRGRTVERRARESAPVSPTVRLTVGGCPAGLAGCGRRGTARCSIDPGLWDRAGSGRGSGPARRRKGAVGSFRKGGTGCRARIGKTPRSPASALVRDLRGGQMATADSADPCRAPSRPLLRCRSDPATARLAGAAREGRGLEPAPRPSGYSAGVARRSRVAFASLRCGIGQSRIGCGRSRSAIVPVHGTAANRRRALPLRSCRDRSRVLPTMPRRRPVAGNRPDHRTARRMSAGTDGSPRRRPSPGTAPTRTCSDHHFGPAPAPTGRPRGPRPEPVAQSSRTSRPVASDS